MDPIALPQCPVASRNSPQPTQHAKPLLQDALHLPRGRKGKIRSVNRTAYTYDVVIDGNTQPVTMGRMLADFNDATLLPIGATVAISYEYGQPLIIGVIPITASRDDVSSATPTISTDPANQEVDPPPESAYCRLPHMPDNLLPQDKVLVSPDGNMMGALSGGINTMKSGMAQIRTHVLGDLAEIICRNYRHVSDFGITEIKNTDGKVSLTLRGGTDQTTECGADQENWTVRLDINGEDLFRFELTSPTGTTLFKLAVNNDGKVELFGADGVDLGGGRNRDEAILGNRTLSVGGDETKSIEGAQAHQVVGNRQATVSGSETRVIGNDLTESAIRHVTESVGGVHTETVTGGNPLTAIPQQVARKTRVVNGSWEIDIGNPLSGANPAALAGFKLKTFSGDISMAVQVLGNVDFSTLLGNASLSTKAGIASLTSALGAANVDGTIVQLGPMAGAVNPLVLGLPYSTALTTFLTTVIAAGTAAAAGSLTEPVAAALGSALASAGSALLGQIPSMLSTKSFTA